MDLIADALTRIKNASIRKFPEVDVKKSNLIKSILEILKKEGFIENFYQSTNDKYSFTVKLKYYQKNSVINGCKRVSKLGRRIYVRKEKIPRVYNNYGIAILSTSKGILTDKEARALGVGGEVLCYIW